MGYKVDLTKYTAECDANYLYLLRLFPDMASTDVRVIALGGVQLSIKVKQRMPYTTELELTQSSEKFSPPWAGVMIMKVRIYHDLKTAEVCEFGERKSPAPKNSYPNKLMHHRDEKIQWNRFLREWLSHVSAHGYSAKKVLNTGTNAPLAYDI